MDEEDGFSTTPTSRHSPFLSFARDHLALLVPVIGALIFAIRCVTVSAGDPQVAFTLATQTSIGDAIRALLFTVVPFLMLMFVYVAAFAAVRQIYSDGELVGRLVKGLGMGIASVALVVGFLYLQGGSRPIAGVSLLTFIVIAYPPAWLLAWALNNSQRVARLSMLGPKDEVMRRQMLWRLIASLVVAVVVAPFLLFVLGQLGDQTFWLPPERLDFQNEEPFTGYVLKTSDDYLIILSDKPRIIVEKAKTTLEDRDFCYPDDHRAQFSKLAADSPTCP